MRARSRRAGSRHMGFLHPCKWIAKLKALQQRTTDPSVYVYINPHTHPNPNSHSDPDPDPDPNPNPNPNPITLALALALTLALTYLLIIGTVIKKPCKWIAKLKVHLALQQRTTDPNVYV